MPAVENGRGDKVATAVVMFFITVLHGITGTSDACIL